MNVNLTLTKDYRKKDDFVVRINKPNSNPISEKPKMNVNAFLQKDYENEPPSVSKKTKPKQTQFPKSQNERNIACRKIWPHPTVNTLAEVVEKFATNRYYQELICPIPMSDVCNI